MSTLSIFSTLQNAWQRVREAVTPLPPAASPAAGPDAALQQDVGRFFMYCFRHSRRSDVVRVVLEGSTDLLTLGDAVSEQISRTEHMFEEHGIKLHLATQAESGKPPHRYSITLIGNTAFASCQTREIKPTLAEIRASGRQSSPAFSPAA
jgi:hypothetical protein